MHLSDDLLNIDTPENVAFGYNVAGIGSRFMAAMVDTIVIIVLQVVVNLALTFILNMLSLNSDLVDDAQTWLVALFGLVSFFSVWGYFIVFEMIWNGQSLGKRWMGLRVIRTDGTPITLVESIIRNLVRLVDFLPFAYGVGLVTMFINAQARRLGDLAAGTLVVFDKGEITLSDLNQGERRLVSPILNISDEALNLPLDRLSNQDWLMIEDFLRRQYDLSNTSELAEKLVRYLYEQMALPAPSINSQGAKKRLAEMYQVHRKEG
ncbi:MAG: RDD family protein [Chloroflexota bacterium]